MSDAPQYVRSTVWKAGIYIAIFVGIPVIAASIYSGAVILISIVLVLTLIGGAFGYLIYRRSRRKGSEIPTITKS